MLLGEVEIGFVEILRLQAGVNVSLERQQRLTGIVRGKCRLPLAKARGLMSRFIIKNRLTRSEQLVDFNLEGYAFDEAASQGNELVFKRPEQA